MSLAHDQILQLRVSIRQADYDYYVRSAPHLSDDQYDRLMAQLQTLEAEHPELVTPDSPTQRVGGATTGKLPKGEHSVPMLSIENGFDEDSLTKFHQDAAMLVPGDQLRYSVEYKIDGISVDLRYEDGLLVRALTRGNGAEGDDVTHTVRTIRNLPLRLLSNPVGTFEVRGEIYIGNKDFQDVQLDQAAHGEKVGENSRNTASGAVQQSDPAIAARRKLTFLAHGMGKLAAHPVTYSEFVERCEKYGLPTIPYRKGDLTFGEMMDHVRLLVGMLETTDLPVDGAVVKVERLTHQQLLGNAGKYPRWAIAYKWQRFEAETTVTGIRVQVGKTGALTPVVDLEPVSIAETTVTKASAFNFDEIRRLDVRVGDKVVVEKAGKIIPHILRVLLHERPPFDGTMPVTPIPTQCPECKSDAVKDPEGVYIRCINPDCPAQIQETISAFGSRKCMNIMSMGPKMVELLYNAGLVRSVADLYRLENRREELLALPGVKDKKANTLLLEISESKRRPFERLLCGLNIRHVGETVSKALVRRFGTADRLLQATPEEIQAIPGIGATIVASLENFLNSERGLGLLLDLSKLGLNMGSEESIETEQPGGPLAGKTVVPTGIFRHFSRDSIKEAILQHGGKAGSSISKKTAYAIVGSAPGPEKVKKIQEYSIPTLTEQAFCELVGMDLPPIIPV